MRSGFVAWMWVYVAFVPTVRAESPRVLVVESPDVPRFVQSALRATLETHAAVIASGPYITRARARGVSPMSARTVRRLGPLDGAQLILLVSYRVRGRARSLSVHFHAGRTGALVSVHRYALSPGRMPRRARQAFHRHVRAALAQAAPEPSEAALPPESLATGPLDQASHPDPPPDGAPADSPATPDASLTDDAPEEVFHARGHPSEGTPGDPAMPPAPTRSQWGLRIGGGGGLAMRTIDVPLGSGAVYFDSGAYFVLQGFLRSIFRPEPNEDFSLRLSVRYTTSVAQSAAVVDNSTGASKSVGIGLHHLLVGFGVKIPLVADSLSLGLDGGLNFRLFDSHDGGFPFPEFGLAGPYARAALILHPLRWLTLGIVPELGYLAALGDGIGEAAGVDGGVLFGGEAFATYHVVPEFALTLLYRESHVFSGSPNPGNLDDRERYFTLNAAYGF